MSRYELRHEHAERTTRLLYCLMRDEKFDVIFAMQKINNGYEATAKRFYPIKPKRIGAQAFCMEALRLTSKENLTGMLIPRAGPSPFRCSYTNYIPRAVDTSAEGKQWSEGLNPDGYIVVSDEPEKDPSQYYKEYYMKHKAMEKWHKSMEKWGDRVGMTHYTQEEYDISETDTTTQALTEEMAQKSSEKKKKKNKKTGGGKEKKHKKAAMYMQENPYTSETETTAPKLTEKKKGKKRGSGKERKDKKAAMRKKAAGKNVAGKN